MLRQAEQQDAGEILCLARDFATSFEVDEVAFHAAFTALLADPSAYVAVTEAENAVVGYVLAFSHNSFYANGRVAWVEEIMVNAGCRRQGIGKELLVSVEAWASVQGCKLIALATRRASGFYEALDYHASATYYRKLI